MRAEARLPKQAHARAGIRDVDRHNTSGRDRSCFTGPIHSPRERGVIMLSWAVTFLVIGLIAGVLGVSGVAGTATHIAYVLFVIFLILAAIGMVMGKRPPVS